MNCKICFERLPTNIYEDSFDECFSCIFNHPEKSLHYHLVTSCDNSSLQNLAHQTNAIATSRFESYDLPNDDDSNLPNAMNQTERTGSEQRAPLPTVSSIFSDKIRQVAYDAARDAAQQMGILEGVPSLTSDNLLENGRFNLGQACRRTVQNVNAAMQPPPSPANTMSSSSTSSNVQTRVHPTHYDLSNLPNPQKRPHGNSSATSSQPKRVQLSNSTVQICSVPRDNPLISIVYSPLENPSSRDRLGLAFQNYMEKRNQNNSDKKDQSCNAAELLSEIAKTTCQPIDYLYQFFQKDINPITELDAETCSDDDQKNDIFQILGTLQPKIVRQRSLLEKRASPSEQQTAEYLERGQYIQNLLKDLQNTKQSFTQEGRIGNRRFDVKLSNSCDGILAEYLKSSDEKVQKLFRELCKTEKLVYAFIYRMTADERLAIIQRLENLGIDIDLDFYPRLRKGNLKSFGTDIDKCRELIEPLRTKKNTSPSPPPHLFDLMNNPESELPF
jgi:hypothetical protein